MIELISISSLIVKTIWNIYCRNCICVYTNNMIASLQYFQMKLLILAYLCFVEEVVKNLSALTKLYTRDIVNSWDQWHLRLLTMQYENTFYYFRQKRKILCVTIKVECIIWNNMCSVNVIMPMLLLYAMSALFALIVWYVPGQPQFLAQKYFQQQLYYIWNIFAL